MTENQAKLGGPDLAQGVPLSTIPDGGMLAGHAHGEPALIARRGSELFAIGAVCTHYGAPLAEGLLDGDTVRCQWHHACFSLRTGEALRAPALDAVPCWQVEQSDGMVFVRGKLRDVGRKPSLGTFKTPTSVVIVGGGAAGNAAAEMLRREAFSGTITMLSADETLPYDRTQLSKDYLSGAADATLIPLRSAEFYREHDITLHLGARVTRLDIANRQVLLADGSRHGYDALLLATGAEAVQLDVPGADLPHVHTLRTLADSRAIVAATATSKRAVVIGSSFIGLEVASSLRARSLEVHVVTQETCPMERSLGAAVGAFIRDLHETHGVTFHLGTAVTSINAQGVTLKNGERLDADLVVIGIGVRPALGLAEQAGLATDQGLTVNEFLESSVPGIFAAGDIARWPDPLSGERIRVEHWVVAERQGQTAARNILGHRERFDAVPFFWTMQYDFKLGYVGHAVHFDQMEIAGSLAARDCAITYRRAGQKVAVATVQRDLVGLRAEVEFERTIAAQERAASDGSHPRP